MDEAESRGLGSSVALLAIMIFRTMASFSSFFIQVDCVFCVSSYSALVSKIN